jgi:hypothetical protein
MTHDESRSENAETNGKTKDPERTIERMLAASYPFTELAIQHAVEAIVRTVEECGALDEIFAVLTDPWRPLRDSIHDYVVLRRALGTGLRWVASRPRAHEDHDAADFLNAFAIEVGAQVALSAFTTRHHDGGEALIIRVQRRQHADVFLRGAVVRTGDRFAVAPFTHSPLSEEEDIPVFPTEALRSAAPATLQIDPRQHKTTSRIGRAALYLIR